MCNSATPNNAASRSLPAALVQAYEATCYRVLAEPAFVLTVSEASPELKALYESSGVKSAAFVTAWNPYSKPHSQTENRAGNEALEAALREAGFTQIISGFGEDPSGKWPGEESLLVFGISLEAGKAFAASFQQNAFIWAGPDAKPELIITV